jgi:hypothetical protein
MMDGVPFFICTRWTAQRFLETQLWKLSAGELDWVSRATNVDDSPRPVETLTPSGDPTRGK